MSDCSPECSPHLAQFCSPECEAVHNANEVTRLRAEVARLEAVADSSASLAESLAERLRSAWDRAESAEAALTRVLILTEPIDGDDERSATFKRLVRSAALDPTSPATRPSADDHSAPHWCFDCADLAGDLPATRTSPAPADDEGTGTGAAPSEGHSEARCHADRDGDCNWSQCPQLRDGEPVASGRHCPLDIGDGGW